MFTVIVFVPCVQDGLMHTIKGTAFWGPRKKRVKRGDDMVLCKHSVAIVPSRVTVRPSQGLGTEPRNNSLGLVHSLVADAGHVSKDDVP